MVVDCPSFFQELCSFDLPEGPEVQMTKKQKKEFLNSLTCAEFSTVPMSTSDEALGSVSSFEKQQEPGSETRNEQEPKRPVKMTQEVSDGRNFSSNSGLEAGSSSPPGFIVP